MVASGNRSMLYRCETIYIIGTPGTCDEPTRVLSVQSHADITRLRLLQNRVCPLSCCEQPVNRQISHNLCLDRWCPPSEWQGKCVCVRMRVCVCVMTRQNRLRLPLRTVCKPF